MSCDFLYILMLAVEVLTESGRINALDTIDQNATNDQSGM